MRTKLISTQLKYIPINRTLYNFYTLKIFLIITLFDNELKTMCAKLSLSYFYYLLRNIL